MNKITIFRIIFMVLLLSATTLPSNAQITQAVADSIVTMNTMSQNSYSVVYRKNGVVNKSERVFSRSLISTFGTQSGA